MDQATEAAIDKITDLLTQSQAVPESAPLLFPLDQKEIVRELEVIYDEDTKITLYHKLKWPDFESLDKRQRQTPYRTQVLGAGRTRSENDDGVTANANLWDKFRVQVRGYEWNGADPDEWVDVTDELAAEIPSEHKSEAIVGLFASQFEVERPKAKGFVLGAQSYRVKQTYGPYTIYHVFGKPGDKDRRDLGRKSHEVHNQPGTSKGKREVYTNLKPYCDLYDKIFDRLEGVTGADPNIARRKDLINALWKLGAIEALMESFEAPRRDSSRN
jgi:hypothetical protein